LASWSPAAGCQGDGVLEIKCPAPSKPPLVAADVRRWGNYHYYMPQLQSLMEVRPGRCRRR
jgi:hypothetical protein